MKRLRIKAVAQQPLLLGDKATGSGNSLISAAQINGTSLRGCLAESILYDMDERNPWFQRAIVQEALSCGALYPIKKCQVQAGPAPATGRRCKREREHPLRDVLFQQLSSQAHDMPACDRCSSKLVRIKESLGFSAKGPTLSKPKDQLITSAAMNDRVESVAEGKLFSQVVLNEGSRFQGDLLLPDDLDPDILMAISTIRVGIGKTRGFGKLSLEWQLWEGPIFEAQPLSQRLDQLSSLAQRSGVALTQDEYLLTLDLQSPLLLSDDLMQPRFQLEASDLAVYGTDLDWQILPHQARPYEVGGWLTLINRPAPRRVALAPGTVIPLLVRGPRQKILATCEALQKHGLGEAWGAGFGHLVINHPFHFSTTGGGF